MYSSGAGHLLPVGGGELFWESLEDFQNNLQFILATLDKIAYLESNAPAPGSSVLVSSKESLISEHLKEATLSWEKGQLYAKPLIWKEFCCIR